MRVGLFERDLAYRFNISVGTVSNTIVSWVNFLYLRLGSLSIWPSKEKIVETMPDSFKSKYKETRLSANTLKGLVGISPSGSLTFISQLYTGSVSDREITERCRILKMPFQAGDTCDGRQRV